MAVGLHAVRRGEVNKREVAIVIGCGPVGLAVISMLKASGVRKVIASDFSAGRRALAGAVRRRRRRRPGEGSPYRCAEERVHRRSHRGARSGGRHDGEAAQAAGALARRLARRRGRGAMPKGPVVFECVGVPGVIESIVTGAPPWSRVVVVGVCMDEDRFRPLDGDEQGDRPALRPRLHAARVPRDAALIAEGKVDVAADHGHGGLAGVESAFDRARRSRDPREDPDRPSQQGDRADLAPGGRPNGRGLTRTASPRSDGRPGRGTGR